jgi:hypothetical protein
MQHDSMLYEFCMEPFVVFLHKLISQGQFKLSPYKAPRCYAQWC